MKARDQAEGGDDDARKTVQLDDTHRVRILSGGERGDSEKGARPRVPMRFPSKETRPPDGQWLEAESTLVYARAEFKSAAAAVISRIKAGEDLPKPELDREWNARLRFLQARQLFERLSHLRKASRTAEEDRPIGERK